MSSYNDPFYPQITQPIMGIPDFEVEGTAGKKYPTYSIRKAWEIVNPAQQKQGAAAAATGKDRQRIEMLTFEQTYNTRSLKKDIAKAYMQQTQITNPIVYLGQTQVADNDELASATTFTHTGVWFIQRIRIIDLGNKNSRITTILQLEDAFVPD